MCQAGIMAVVVPSEPGGAGSVQGNIGAINKHDGV